MGSYAREDLRRTFLPTKVRVLFAGESPPAAGAFFYAADSGLYRATRDAFYEAMPQLEEGPFLEQFAALGCYLDDFCHEPVNDLRSAERVRARRAAEMPFAQRLREFQPYAIIVLLKAIAPNVERAATVAGCGNIERHVVTYPSRWYLHRAAYRQELVPLLRDFMRRGVLSHAV